MSQICNNYCINKYNQSKVMKRRLSILSLFVFVAISGFACTYTFSVDGGKSSCSSGEEFVVTVKLVNTHRVCNGGGAAATKFKLDGVKVMGATDWKEVGTGTFTRQLKIKVLDGAAKKVSITATRTCDKEGGFAVFNMTKK